MAKFATENEMFGLLSRAVRVSLASSLIHVSHRHTRHAEAEGVQESAFYFVNLKIFPQFFFSSPVCACRSARCHRHSQCEAEMGKKSVAHLLKGRQLFVWYAINDNDDATMA